MTVRLNFFSDTNLSQAKSELDILDLETLQQEGYGLVLSSREFFELEEPILAVVEAWGGSVDY